MATICDSYSESNYSAEWNDHVCQSFTGNGGILDSVKLYLRKSGTPTGSINIKIYAHSGTYGTSSLPDLTNLLATSDDFDISTLGLNLGLANITFSGDNKITLINGTHYVLMMDDNPTSVYYGDDEISPTHPGNMCLLDIDEWVAHDDYDLCFYVYTDSTTSIKDIISPGIIAAPR